MSDLLYWLDLFDLKQKRLVQYEDEGICSAVPPQFTLLRQAQEWCSLWPTIIGLRYNGALPCSFYSAYRFSSAIFPGDIRRWGTEGASSHGLDTSRKGGTLDQRPPSLSALPDAYSSRSEFW